MFPSVRGVFVGSAYGTLRHPDSGVFGRIDAKVAADLPHQFIANFRMTRDRGTTVQRSVDEPGVAAPLPIEFTAMLAESAVERAPLHTAMRTSSKCSEAAERASARLASSASCRVIRRLSRSSSRDASWPFTPGTSSIQPIHQAPFASRLPCIRSWSSHPTLGHVPPSVACRHLLAAKCDGLRLYR